MRLLNRRSLLFVVVLLAGCILSAVSPAPVFAFWPFEKQTPVGDRYLEDLFRPDYEHESVKIYEDSKGYNVIVVRMQEKVTDDGLGRYNQLLLKRGVNIYGRFHVGVLPWQVSTSEASLSITRKVEGEPDTIEVSKSVIMEGKEYVLSTQIKGREIRFAVTKDFGKKWEKIRIIPDREPAGDVKLRRYPGSILREVSILSGGGTLQKYVVKAPFNNVAYFFDDYLKKEFGYEHPGEPFMKEKLAEPDRYRTAIKIFGVNTNGVRLNFTTFSYIGKKPVGMLKIRLEMSSDANLSEYISITYQVDLPSDWKRE